MRLNVCVLALLIAATARLAQAEVKIHSRLEAFDTIGNPITLIPLGSHFELRAYVDDVRLSTPIGGNLFGTFAAYVQVDFDGGKVTAAGPVDVANFFSAVDTVAATGPGLIRGGGSTLSIVNPGPAEQLLFTVPLQATAAGTVTFSPSYLQIANPFPHEWLLYGEDAVIEPDEVAFFDIGVTIVPEPSGVAPVAVAIIVVSGLVARRRRRSQLRAV